MCISGLRLFYKTWNLKVQNQVHIGRSEFETVPRSCLKKPFPTSPANVCGNRGQRAPLIITSSFTKARLQSHDASLATPKLPKVEAEIE